MNFNKKIVLFYCCVVWLVVLKIFDHQDPRTIKTNGDPYVNYICVDLRPRHLVSSMNDLAPYEFCAPGSVSLSKCGDYGLHFCDSRLAARVQNLSFEKFGSEYTCLNLGASLILIAKDQSAPHKDCLGGDHSWKRCERGMFLCKSGLDPFKIAQSRCDSKQRLTIKEYLARYNCKEERYIVRSMSFLSSCAPSPSVNRSAMKLFWDHDEAAGPALAKIQIVNASVIYTYRPNAFHVRFRPIISDVISVLSQTKIGNSEFYIWAHDGWAASTLPRKSPYGDLCVPLFVQEMDRESRAILAPSRSLLGFLDLSEVSRNDNWIVWSEKTPMAVWRGRTTGPSYILSALCR
jgi:hypothetical protein